MRRFVALARRREVVRRAAKVALIVGTTLTLINQGDFMLAGMAPNLIKMALTFLVPYCVSTHGAVTAIHEQHQRRIAR